MEEITHIEAIRLLSGIFTNNSDQMMARLGLINLIARNSLEMAEDDFTDEQCKRVGIVLKREVASDANLTTN